MLFDFLRNFPKKSAFFGEKIAIEEKITQTSEKKVQIVETTK